jgi:hypothetical protein
MRFFLKVLVLVGLIVLGKVAKQTAVNATTQADVISQPVYSQNNDNMPSPRPAGLGKDIQKASYYFSY